MKRQQQRGVGTTRTASAGAGRSPGKLTAVQKRYAPAPTSARPAPAHDAPDGADAHESAAAGGAAEGGEAASPEAAAKATAAAETEKEQELEKGLASVPADKAFDVATAGAPAYLPFANEMEEKFGTSLSDIEVHLGTPEAKLGLSMMGAEAATHGRKIVFASESPGKELVAHELTHIVQNKQGGATGDGAGAALSSPGQATEREASSVGAAAASSDAPVDVSELGASNTIHRSFLGGLVGGIIGAVGGAVIGGLLGGPVGAIIGAVVGGIAGAIIGDAVSGGGSKAPARPTGAAAGAGSSVAGSFLATRYSFAAPAFGKVSWNAHEPTATYAAWVDGNNWRFRLESLALRVPVGVASGGRKNVSGANSAEVTQAKWQKIETDLRPAGGTPNRSPRSEYWAQDLTWDHEVFHFDEFNTFLKTSFTTFETTIEGTGYSDPCQADDTQAKALSRRQADLKSRMLAAWNQAKTNMSPGMENRAYDDGIDAYTARADAVKAHAATEGW